jgi:hypothetical protein
LLDGGDNPAKEQFGGAPAAVALEEFLDGDGFLVERVSGIQGANEFIDGMEEDSAGNAVMAGIALTRLQKLSTYTSVSAKGSA